MVIGNNVKIDAMTHIFRNTEHNKICTGRGLKVFENSRESNSGAGKIEALIVALNENKEMPLNIKIENSTRLRDDLGLDSFDLADLTVRIESEFGIDVFEDGVVNTVGEVIEKINRSNGK